MKVLVQDLFTGCYLQDEDVWVRDCNEARDFVSGVRALEYCETHGLQYVQVRFHGPGGFLSIILQPFGKKPGYHPAMVTPAAS